MGASVAVDNRMVAAQVFVADRSEERFAAGRAAVARMDAEPFAVGMAVGASSGRHRVAVQAGRGFQRREPESGYHRRGSR